MPRRKRNGYNPEGISRNFNVMKGGSVKRGPLGIATPPKVVSEIQREEAMRDEVELRKSLARAGASPRVKKRAVGAFRKARVKHGMVKQFTKGGQIK